MILLVRDSREAGNLVTVQIPGLREESDWRAGGKGEVEYIPLLLFQSTGASSCMVSLLVLGDPDRKGKVHVSSHHPAASPISRRCGGVFGKYPWSSWAIGGEEGANLAGESCSCLTSPLFRLPPPLSSV